MCTRHDVYLCFVLIICTLQCSAGSSISDSSSIQLRVANRKQALLRGLEQGVRGAEEEARVALSEHMRDVLAMLRDAE